MKRREFIKNCTVLSLSTNLPHVQLGHTAEEKSLSILQSLSLLEFYKEEDETPQLVSSDSGKAWLFTLRRLPFPQRKEIISVFCFDGNTWAEKSPVTSTPGEFETPAAACAFQSEPAVAWARKRGTEWDIFVSICQNGEFSSPQLVKTDLGRAINPVIIAPSKNRYWLAWECYHKGGFSICLSKYENGKWEDPIRITEPERNCFDPALAEGKDGNLYLAYGVTDGVHQNIEMKIIDRASLKIARTIPVAIGGTLKGRVNLNTKPSLAFDGDERLWISWESNRNTTRLNDSDNYTGDRCCSIVCFKGNKIMELENEGKWLFSGDNDHLPTFVKDLENRLFLITRCGGNSGADRSGNRFWKFRLSWLDPQKGWTKPQTILQTTQQGQTAKPAMAFIDYNSFWLAWINENFNFKEGGKIRFQENKFRVRESRLDLVEFKAPKLTDDYAAISLKPTQVEEYHPNEGFFPYISGRPRVERRTMEYKGEKYTLLLGDLHEHSESSKCWPAGTDGTVHDDYRYGLYSEGYDFVGITDHAWSINEAYWRKNLRMADFYNDPEYFIALPAVEWTKSPSRQIEGVERGSGHRNIIFASSVEAWKYVRNEQGLYSARTPETDNSEKLWKLLHEKNIDCVAIPHHPADESLSMCWQVHDDELEPVVELFQCRGNAEYPGCPRENNLPRHRSSKYKYTFVDYALREKKYKLGFIASGEHDSMGVGLAAIWVKEISRKGILEALRSRRCYATTGDKIFLDFRINGTLGGETVSLRNAPKMTFSVQAVQPIKSIEILRNSRVIKMFEVKAGKLTFNGSFVDNEYKSEQSVLYYYLRVIQDNDHIGWSSPIWIEFA